MKTELAKLLDQVIKIMLDQEHFIQEKGLTEEYCNWIDKQRKEGGEKTENK
jgi:hypothetical protein